MKPISLFVLFLVVCTWVNYTECFINVASKRINWDTRDNKKIKRLLKKKMKMLRKVKKELKLIKRSFERDLVNLT